MTYWLLPADELAREIRKEGAALRILEESMHGISESPRRIRISWDENILQFCAETGANWRNIGAAYQKISPCTKRMIQFSNPKK